MGGGLFIEEADLDPVAALRGFLEIPLKRCCPHQCLDSRETSINARDNPPKGYDKARVENEVLESLRKLGLIEDVNA